MRHAARAIGGDRPSALVTYNHEDAMHVYLIALQQGLRVPRDLSIATNSWPVPSALGSAFTTMQTPFVEVGGRGVAMLLERITAPDEPLASVAVPPTLYVGDTTAPSQ
jgi:DNA-binding LacI/PurR family transcriptional regulator